MNSLIMLIGLPASGKTSYAQEMKKRYGKELEIISSDAIRKELFGSEEEQRYNEKVFNEVFHRTKKSILKNKITIIDATNLSRKRRIAFLKQFDNCEKRATVFAIPFEVCCERNNSRERTVPQYAMDRMYRSFEPPHGAEGFDKINIITFDNLVSIDDILMENAKCEHDNPHHRLSCGMHCYAAADYIWMKYGYCEDIFINDNYLILYLAAKYHDMSKYKVKVFHNMKGEPTIDAHYYFHQNVSAYDFLAHFNGFLSTEKLILIANLISNHMVFFESGAAIDKKKKLYGEEFWKLLEIVHEADLAAH